MVYTHMLKCTRDLAARFFFDRVTLSIVLGVQVPKLSEEHVYSLKLHLIDKNILPLLYQGALLWFQEQRTSVEMSLCLA